ncbi:MAG: hypothetical protein NVS9B15_06090 [Acidobacteriaceae bacterium]
MPAEIPDAQRGAIEQTALRLDQAVVSGDANTIRTSAIPTVAQSFDAISAALQQMQPQVSGGKAQVVTEYVLNQDQPGSVDAQFYCGIVNDASRVHVAFQIPKLPQGVYSFIMTDITGGKTPYRVSYVLQQSGGQWQVAGFFPKPLEAGGHDGGWYWKQARDYKAKNQNHDAYFYLLTAQDLLQPVGFMSSTNNLDKLFQEQQGVAQPDIPADKPVTFATPDGKSYQLTQMFPTTDDKGNLVLVVKYAVPDISNTGAAFQANQAIAKALVQKYPELKLAFGSIVPRATAPNNQDFGSEFKTADL